MMTTRFAREYMVEKREQYNQIGLHHNGACQSEVAAYDIAIEAMDRAEEQARHRERRNRILKPLAKYAVMILCEAALVFYMVAYMVCNAVPY